MKSLLPIAMTVGALIFAGTASAQNYGYSSTSGSSGAINYSYQAGPLDHAGRRQSLKGASETAYFYYRVGVKAYEADNFEKAERSFKTALRAQNAGLKSDIYLYLAKISEASGDLEEAAKFAQKYTLELRLK